MVKEISLVVPKYVKKFVLSEPDYTLLPDGSVKVPRISELGRVIFGVSLVIPYTQRIQATPVAAATEEKLRLRYHCRTKAFELPVEKYRDLALYLEELFRASLIREVTAVHAIMPGDDYSWIIRSVLSRRGIIVDDELDKDIDWQTVKKIYRDHLDRIQKENAKNRRISLPVLSRPEPFCPA